MGLYVSKFDIEYSAKGYSRKWVCENTMFLINKDADEELNNVWLELSKAKTLMNNERKRYFCCLWIKGCCLVLQDTTPFNKVAQIRTIDDNAFVQAWLNEDIDRDWGVACIKTYTMAVNYRHFNFYDVFGKLAETFGSGERLADFLRWIVIEDLDWVFKDDSEQLSPADKCVRHKDEITAQIKHIQQEGYVCMFMISIFKSANVYM